MYIIVIILSMERVPISYGPIIDLLGEIRMVAYSCRARHRSSFLHIISDKLVQEVVGPVSKKVLKCTVVNFSLLTNYCDVFK